jgi:hypothetical protein
MEFDEQEQKQLAEYLSREKEKTALLATLEDSTIQDVYKKIKVINASRSQTPYFHHFPSAAFLNKLRTSQIFPEIRTLITNAVIQVKTKPIQPALQDSHPSYLAQLPPQLIPKIVTTGMNDQKIAKIYVYFLTYLKNEIEFIKKMENEKELMSSWLGIPPQHTI